jgi:hypothetical protein
MKIRKSELRQAINEQVQAFFVTPHSMGMVGMRGNSESTGNNLKETDINKEALKDVIRQIVVDVEKSSHKRMVGEISGVDSLKPNDPHTPEDEAEKDAADDVMEADPKAKKGGRPRGGPHIENVRFWDLPESSLRYIIKDASDAVGRLPFAKKAGKWADEVNDAVTVLHWRKKKGITVDESFNTAPAGQGKAQASVIGANESPEMGSLATSSTSKALIKKMHALVTKKLKFKTVEDIQPTKDGVAFIFGDKAEASKMAKYLKNAGVLGRVLPLAAGGGKRTMVSLKTSKKMGEELPLYSDYAQSHKEK